MPDDVREMFRRLDPGVRPRDSADFDELWRRGRRRRRALQLGGVVASVLAAAAVVVGLPHLMNAPPTLEVAEQPAGCPVTIPSGDFVPPGPYPADAEDRRWYGTDELWTVLDADGDYQHRKSVWWSENFPGGQVEEQPPITVRWERLDQPDLPPIVSDRGTNAYTDRDGWFMIAGIDPDIPGCWRVTANYKGAQLSYVYHLPDTATDA